MKAIPLKRADGTFLKCKPEDATHVEIHVPGPFPCRILPVILRGTREGTGCWSWNGSTTSPTLKPSIKTWTDNTVCHSWVNDGRIRFLADSTHSLAGQTRDLLEVDDWYEEE